MPRWVKFFIVVFIAIAVAMVVLMLFGKGQHGPRRHLSDMIPVHSELIATL
jgi:preprotein translocase subunit SecG